MAENIVKSLKEKSPKIRKKNGFEEIPDVKTKDKIVKPLKQKDTRSLRPRNGSIQMSFNPYGKPKVMGDGRKIK